jgi:hypothetical protein
VFDYGGEFGSLSPVASHREGSLQTREKEGKLMTIEKLAPSGAWLIYGVIEGEGDHYFLKRSYWGYTKREAIRLWRQEMRERA